MHIVHVRIYICYTLHICVQASMFGCWVWCLDQCFQKVKGSVLSDLRWMTLFAQGTICRFAPSQRCPATALCHRRLHVYPNPEETAITITISYHITKKLPSAMALPVLRTSNWKTFGKAGLLKGSASQASDQHLENELSKQWNVRKKIGTIYLSQYYPNIA